MNKHNTYTTLLIFFLIIILSERSSAAHYQYEACEPVSCGTGPNISFPFHIKGVQESYCGYPGFEITCKDTTPVLSLSENEYVVEDIFYQNRSLRVFDAALLGSNGSGCLPRMRNLTLPQPQFSYAIETVLHLFSNCENLSEGFFSRYFHGRCGGDWNNGSFALYDGDENVGVAMEDCEENVVVPVDGFGSVVSEVLRRGFVMKWRASDCSVCHDSGGFCGFNETSFHFRCFCPDRPHLRSCKPEKTRLKLMLAISLPGLAVLLLLSVSIFILWKKKKKIEGSYLLSRNASSNTPKQDVESGSVYFGIPVFSYKELEEATHSFDQSMELGDGGFGTVYYGKLKDGREVAIKRLYEHNYRRMEQFLNEIKILTSLRHPNLVSLYGCTSRTSRELLLVYEYIPNGTVADHLHGERSAEAPLSWPVRMSIAIETATALSYLHKSDIIHRDVKTNNILLDSKFSVKVADFGLSRLFPNNVTHISTAPQGTPGYVDPEYHQFYQLTDKSDVYSFGVVLIELISSMPPVDVNRHRHEINLANLALNRIQRCAFDELIDPSLGYDSDPEVTRMTTTVAELAFRCLQVDKDLRPCMDEVLSFLKDIQGGNCGEIKEGNSNDNHSKIIASPETEDSVLLRNKKFQPSPTAVIDTWVSSASTTTTSFT